eukprot:Em0001g3755a
MPLWVQVPKFYCFGAATVEQKAEQQEAEKAEQEVEKAEQEVEKTEQKVEKTEQKVMTDAQQEAEKEVKDAEQKVEKAQQLDKDLDNEQNETLLSIAIPNLKTASDKYRSASTVLTSARTKLMNVADGGPMVPSADGGPMVPSADGDGGPAIWKYSVPVAIPHYSCRSAQFPSSFPSQHIIPVEVLGFPSQYLLRRE